jgi:hypothetical protein
LIDEKELHYWISKLESEQSSWTNYEKLAILYIIQNQHETRDAYTQIAAYSGAAAPDTAFGDSEFMQAVKACDAIKAWGVMDELMDALKVTNTRVYDNVMRKLNN